MRKYYSSRNNKKILDFPDLVKKIQGTLLYFLGMDYFKEKANICYGTYSDKIKYEALIALNFQPFPIDGWIPYTININNLFDIIEFMYDYISKPGEKENFVDGGYNYTDYVDYDEISGKQEYRGKVNYILSEYGEGFELSEEGEILSLPNHGIEQIVDTEIPEYNLKNVDLKVEDAVKKWRNRDLNISDRRQAIIELANVFEWLKKDGKLDKALSNKDEKALFEIANKFALRHHDPEQKTEYDKDIWYSWIFHFYLATYHAVIRMLKRNEEEK